MIPLPLSLLARIDSAWLAERRRRMAGKPAVTAGAGIHSDQAIPFLQEGDVWWPDFPPLAHSFWRAQEVTLFRRNMNLIRGHVVDLGCGDGIFGQIAGFPEGAVGADFDRPSLEIRQRVLPGAESVWADAGKLPFESDRFDTAVSNSVFEHLPDLPACFAELFRVLVPGGRLLFTMTLGTFTRHLEELTGKGDAALWIGAFGHHQQPSRPEVETLLTKVGFTLDRTLEYQPVWASRIYRRLLSPVEESLVRKWTPARRTKEIHRLIPEVDRSLRMDQDGTGACLWVVATKPDVAAP
jgi:SAM-dependent methyltransferase